MQVVAKLRQVLSGKGIAYAARAGAKIMSDWIASRFWWVYYETFYAGKMRQRTFTFDGVSYGYTLHRYNTTYRSERAVEIPIATRLLDASRGKRVLEVGNVLSHYHPGSHEVLDKYERVDGIVNVLEGYDPGGIVIVNQDVTEFQPGRPYDVILSVSTLEHVGWDEEPRDPAKIRRAFDHLESLLAPGGQLWFTAPVGYNPELDRLLGEEPARFTRLGFLLRVSKDNIWREATWEEVRHARYNTPFPSANAVAIGVIRKSP